MPRKNHSQLSQTQRPAGVQRARFENGIYRDCKWCAGRGCLACPGEADKEYNRQFPNGPQPIATFSVAEIEGSGGIVGLLKSLIGPDAVMAAKDEARRKLDAPGVGSILRQLGGATGGPLTDAEKEGIVAGMAGDVLAENIRKAASKKQKGGTNDAGANV